jgi:hypothetical protein
MPTSSSDLVAIDTKPSNLSEADKKSVEAAEAVAETIED